MTVGYHVVDADESESTIDIDDCTVKVLRAWRKARRAEPDVRSDV